MKFLQTAFFILFGFPAKAKSLKPEIQNQKKISVIFERNQWNFTLAFKIFPQKKNVLIDLQENLYTEDENPELTILARFYKSSIIT